MSDLSIIFPEPKEITISGETFVLTPFTFGQLPKVLKHVKPIFGVVGKLLSEGENIGPGIVLSVMAEGGEDLIQLLVLSAKKPREWFDTLQADEGIKLLTAFLEVNVSFFVRSVLPTFKDAMESLTKTAMAGQSAT